jgi:hypothetical protein
VSDRFKRNFIGDTAQCGCNWQRVPVDTGTGQMLVQCQIHKQASDALYRKITAEMEHDEWLSRAMRIEIRP